MTADDGKAFGMSDEEHDAANEKAAEMVREALARRAQKRAALLLVCQAALSWASELDGTRSAEVGDDIRSAVKIVEEGWAFR